MDWITPVISGASGVIGASVGVFGNILHTRIQQHLREMEQKERRMEQRYLAYNEVLDLNGRERILYPGKGRGWDAELYVQRIRPVLFRNFHLLGDKVRGQVRTLDHRLQRRQWKELTEEDVPDELEYMYYVELIALIEAEYKRT
ncbi:hypothetical protein GCM10025857_14450 [Alicyclobacillus contaminans]|uniref:hypothetical protein n=1 Tax=Alicyclobacillus contaminans TaxID=392016 RepID=UPI000424F0DB|nr:hypothetical protein [Alicyclobacillus contaminans]GMA50088.1 hypothetical protein GCM10025857_14450 [Alicyclobacillus contaminans]